MVKSIEVYGETEDGKKFDLKVKSVNVYWDEIEDYEGDADANSFSLRRKEVTDADSSHQ